MSLNDLYNDPVYNDILFYLSERGFSSSEDLASFDFDELFFVPGLSEELIESAKALFLSAKNSADESESKDEEPEAGSENVLPAGKKEYAQDLVITEIEACCEAMQQAIGSCESADDVNSKRRAIQISSLGIDEEMNLLAVCDEIEAYFKAKIETAFDNERKEREAKIAALANVPVEPIFREVSRGSAMITYCRKNGILSLAQLVDFDFENTKVHGLGKSSMEACKAAYQQAVQSLLSGSGVKPTTSFEGNNDPNVENETVVLSPDLAEPFRKAYYALDARARECLLRKAQGETLQEIGDRIWITRERVRQIINKTVRKLKKSCNGLIKALTNNSKKGFYTHEIRLVLPDSDELECFAYVIQESGPFSTTVFYLDFADKYVAAKEVTEDFYEKMASVSQVLIGDIVNYYNIIDDVEERLLSSGISFLDALDYMGYLLENGYRAIGDYIVRRQSTYRRICYVVIGEYFKNGIKLDNDPENEDIHRLKEIVKKEFSGFALDQSSRALTARVAPDLILCGRGRYIAVENVVYDEALFEEIVDYINESSAPSFYYSELFTAFSGRLYAETSVDNANYLHGMLKYLYPDTFRYERDLLVKLGKKRITFAERLSQMIKEEGGPVTRAAIESAFPGITDIRIANAMVLTPEIIQWEYHQYNHIENIQWNEKDYNALIDAIESVAASQKGYCSEKNLFDRVCELDAEFIQKNEMRSSQNVFYIAAYLLRDKYRFSRPHIAGRAFPIIDLNNVEVAKFFLGGKATLDYGELVELSETLGWAHGTFTMIQNAVEKDYIRIDLNDYIIKEHFSIDDDSLRGIKNELDLLTKENGYYGIFAVISYDRFPEVGFDWNEHLLQSIIETYSVGYKILEPNFRDRRYKRGIIVPQDNACKTYEDFIISQMKEDGISQIGKDAFSGYLRRKGLVMTATIPIELFEGDGVRLEGNYFVYS